MKKLLLLLVLVSVFIFAGCSKVDQPSDTQTDVVSDDNLMDPNFDLDSDLNSGISLVNYNGLSVEAATSLAGVHNTTFRVVEQDGELLPTTKDLRPGRINAVVENGVVVSYTIEAEDLLNQDDNYNNSTEDYIGLNEDEASAMAALYNTSFRVIERDGEPLAVTMDFRPGRINAVVENGVVVSYMVEGSEGM